MKKTMLFVCTIILAACSTQTTPAIPATEAVVPAETQVEVSVVDPTETSTQTLVPPTPTLDLIHVPTHTPQPAATCPSINGKLRASFGHVFKDKKAPYHDARTAVLNFLNEGGDPKIAAEKLAEDNVLASLLDLTHDGVPEFVLPSGYLTIFGCQDGKYVILLDIPPSEDAQMTAVPLAIQDLNQNGLLELLIGQVQSRARGLATYQIFEWDGTGFADIAPVELPEQNENVYIKDSVIYAVGQSNAEKGALEGNWEIADVDGNGLNDIIVRAGVYENFVNASELEDSLVLKWDGTSYVVAQVLREATATPSPTSTPLPFSETCAIKVPELRFQKPQSDVKETILSYLNAGGRLEQLEGSYNTTIEDLNNDTSPEIILIDASAFEPYIMMFTCQSGKYIEASIFPNEIGTFQMNIMAVRDNNKNGFPELFVKDIGCFWMRCGALYVVEWDGDHFAQKISELDYSGETLNYTRMDEPHDSYLKDIDTDGIAELIWTGEITPEWHRDHWAFYPQRLATHTFKWDGSYYTAQLVEYSAPKYRFQAIQDGDLYSKAGSYEKALQSYQLAITSDKLGWWTEELKEYVIGPYGIGPCAAAPCQFPNQNPNERPVLSAYALFRKMVVYLLMGDTTRAETTYQRLLTDHPAGTPGFKITGMANSFWYEYQSSQDIAKACAQAVTFIKTKQPDALVYLTGGYNGLQGIFYEKNPSEVCPFK